MLGCSTGAAVLIAAVPETGAASPWRLAGEELTQPASVHITAASLEAIHHIHRDADTLTVSDVLVIRRAS